MIQVLHHPGLVVLKYIVLIACQVKWAWDCLIVHFFFQPRGIFETPEYIDDLTIPSYENYNHEECGDSSVECAVCLCRIDDWDEVIELSCNHLYHRVCLERWLGYGHRTCSLCRYNLKPPQLVAEHHLLEEVILINFCATRSRDDRRTWWLR
ncbi:unnamed protein product [Fraxinus pennsylvanica]|uniref:RING-type domain-containing protein n=1 Tax=Fraxinus pennsylvanica TaxID=56036 RepID=A0AAD1ZT70_9LAMI|nr:unnamed protein product [Fraxinus pennsylvanica]